MGRAPCCDKVGLKKGPWTPDEDQILISFIQKHGHSNWRALPKQAGLLRCGKSCRLRWINYLKPDIKRGNFTKEEEDTIIQLHEKMGNRWSAIAAKLPGRTDNEIKNVWHTHLKKRLEKYQTTKPQGKKARCTPKCSDGNNVTIANSTAATNFPETSVGTTTVDNVPTSPGQSCSSNGSSSLTEVSSVELSNVNMGAGLNDEQIFDLEQSDLEQSKFDDFPITDETFWSSQDFTSDADDMAFIFSNVIGNDQLQSQSTEDYTMPETCNNLISSTYTEQGLGNYEDNMDFWFDVFVRASGAPELPEF